MSNSTAWRRVSKTARCPVCGRPDWCLFTGDEHDPSAAICSRVESQKRCGDAGWLHPLKDDRWNGPRRRTILSALPYVVIVGSVDLNALAASYSVAASDADVRRLSNELGVSVASLHRLDIGWSAEHRAWSFPMRAPAGGVVGIRLRLASGRKLSVRGGHERLFVPSELTGSGPLLIAEGPTDTAALLDLGFDAIGRPNCSGGTRHVVDYLQLNGVHDVVVVADGDEPGRIGAEKLARILTAYVEDVRVIAPPAGIKDARQWKRMGATHDVITATIGNARWRPLVVSIRRRGSDA